MDEISSVVNNHIKRYFPEGNYYISSVKNPFPGDVSAVNLVEIEPEGWVMVSGDKRAVAILAFSFDGDYFTGDYNSGNPAARWVSDYSTQIEYIKNSTDALPDKSWFYYDDQPDLTKGEDEITVEPIIKVEWNQGAGWNNFCPADPDGPGGHAWVGCVAVAMAQAMSVYGYPASGRGNHSYTHIDYGTLEVDYSTADYRWDEMSLTSPDLKNALLLYHSAVSVSMKFGPDGSSASTSNVPEALRAHFLYSNLISYKRSGNYTALNWKNLIIEELQNGRPVIYRGESEDGSSAHAFNIDGVLDSELFHLNWGWGGKNNGYYALTALSPGTRDYSYDHGAVIRIKPYYYPTELRLSSNIVPGDELPGAAIGTIEITDEGADNQYNIILVCDSSLIGGEWVKDYYVENNILRTGRTFSPAEFAKDTVWFIVSDLYGNLLETESELLSENALSVNQTGYNQLEEIQIYPNPAGSRIFVTRSDRFVPTRVTVYSHTGEIVQTWQVKGDQVALDISELARGIYFIELQSDNGVTVTRKLLKN